MSQRPRKLSLTPRVTAEQPSLSGLSRQAMPSQNNGEMTDILSQPQSPTAMPQQNADTPFASAGDTRQPGNRYGSPPPPFRSSNRPDQTSLPNGGTTTPSGSTGFNTPMNATGTPTGTFSTGALALTNGTEGQGKTGTMKLAQSVKVVQVPVAGQPGRYVTGFLPVLPQTDDATAGGTGSNEKDKLKQKVRLITIMVSVVLIVLLSFTYIVQPFGTSSPAGRLFNPNGAATAAAATAQANTILADPLSQPIHDWPVVTDGSPQYVFKDGAYHVGVGDQNHLALPLLPGENFTKPMAYTVTWDEVNGDDKAQFNWFGIVLRYSEHQDNGNTVRTFYAFVYMPSTGEYQFRKFNDGQDNPWTIVWHHGKGKEYNAGHNAKNTVKVVANGSKFTFIVNGQQVGTAQDKDLTGGQIGMIVNLNGFEIAYSDLVLTYN